MKRNRNSKNQFHRLRLKSEDLYSEVLEITSTKFQSHLYIYIYIQNKTPHSIYTLSYLVLFKKEKQVTN